jgi:hypothetical protein
MSERCFKCKKNAVVINNYLKYCVSCYREIIKKEGKNEKKTNTTKNA